MTNAPPRDSSRKRSWHQRYGEVYEELAAADRDKGLAPPDLERLGMAAYLIGKDREAHAALSRAHQGFLAAGKPNQAARSAFWLSFVLINKGERAPAAGWIARARRLLEGCGQECVEQGYLLLPTALQAVAEGDLTTAEQTFAEAARIGDRFGDADLVTLARQGDGRSLINLGEVTRGSALLDEVMVAVTAGEVSPFVAGTVYCSVIEACFDMFDIRRAREWTDALAQWCASQPDLVPYRGHCVVRRAQILQINGAWHEAIEQAREACRTLSASFTRAALGGAFYQLAELHRLRGAFDQADEAYRTASECGRPPQPGLALLRLAQGRVDSARTAICRAVDETRDRRLRPELLASSVDIMVAVPDVVAARRAADELCVIADAVGTPYLKALASQQTGQVMLAEGDAKAAIGVLRDACSRWRDLGAVYHAARAAMLVALACRALDDPEGAEMEANGARKLFRDIGAAPDLERLDSLFGGDPASRAAAALSPRELQVLRLVATGRTNRAIADALGISEKTVARHLNNIFTKLDLPSRAAATAYAFQHQLI